MQKLRHFLNSFLLRKVNIRKKEIQWQTIQLSDLSDFIRIGYTEYHTEYIITTTQLMTCKGDLMFKIAFDHCCHS